MSPFRGLAFGLIAFSSLIFSPGARADNAALLAFKREQIALAQNLARQAPLYEPDLTRWIEAAKAREKAIQSAQGDAAFSPPSQFHERAYFASNDRSPQPFWVFLPDGYTPSRKWPLVVLLHGYSTTITKLSPWMPPEDVVRFAQKRGVILAVPYGRRNSDFVQWGQDDVLRVREEVTRFYSVDPLRISLLGASMGGYGVYATGFHNPGNWAAFASICGRSDMFLWFKTTPDALPAWKRQLYLADDPRTLLPATLTTPLFVQHGALDGTVPIEHSRRISSDADALKLPFFYYEDPAGDHWAEFQIPAFERALDWLPRLAKNTPRQIAVVAADLREAQNDWAQITAFENYESPARLDVRLEPDKITVQIQNVAGFTLNIPREAYRGATAIPLEINGATEKTADPTGLVGWRKSGAAFGKTPACCGPFKNLMRDPFLLVYGGKQDLDDAQKFAAEWKNAADGDAKILAASEIGSREKTGFNLIFFGDAQSNPLIKELGDLPVKIASPSQGLRLVLPSPWSIERLVGVCQGAWWGEKLPPNHKWDLLPDYIVYEGKNFEGDETNQAIEAGFFDGDWKKTPNTPATETTAAEETTPDDKTSETVNQPTPTD